ncbi:uncharacterized protein L969DRAFT_102509 [Mixia osmundae IAM 14324]|uniref:COP9 signalosome complex subunit 6 n=1 Tax=Mixia osmundae (strain CBS 9802 / IAM 14324 / JCM 22182 / KY 12970) TaxID=764103 RepID=G7DUF1_MIXOS|nr:uncharacterized protein L969DRAFT_102509 [Mixia osmundae IAM 14324]KEI41083.1 hypothetical protein L969DRAFT_102509 [Mixia osmundae IAM 14324]GAA94211.1 hypothetical protein E5Q_00860 [Mixia osmundae IAM 14324]
MEATSPATSTDQAPDAGLASADHDTPELAAGGQSELPDQATSQTAQSESESDEEETSDDEPVPAAVLQREKRSGAGAKMREMLHQELEEEEVFAEEENDQEFAAKDEEDMFDSDFGSTGSEASETDDGAPAVRHRPHASTSKLSKGKRRDEGLYANMPAIARAAKAAARAEQAKLDGPQPIKRRAQQLQTSLSSEARRTSSRRSAVELREAIDTRLQDREARTAQIVNRPKVKRRRSLNQADLIDMALQQEEISRTFLRELSRLEEEYRVAQRTHQIRTAMQGPVLRFVSRIEDHTRALVEEVSVAPVDAEPPLQPPNDNASTLPANEPTVAGSRTDTPLTAYSSDLAPASSPRLVALASTPASDKTSALETEPRPSIPCTAVKNETESTEMQRSLPEPRPAGSLTTERAIPIVLGRHALNIEPSNQPALKRVKSDAPEPQGPHSRNYLILDDWSGSKHDMMTAIFGEHADWKNLRVVSIKNRATNRRVPLCAITGLPSNYKDPKSGVPYAVPSAYPVIRDTLNHKYVWSPVLDCYVSREDSLSSSSVMDDTMTDGSNEGKRSLISSTIESGLTISVHPLPILNISEHLTRTQCQTGQRDVRVAGALIGTQSGREIKVNNTFEIQVEGTKIEHGLLVFRRDQFKQVFPVYDILGWYTVGSQPTEIELAIHEELLAYNESPILLQLMPDQIGSSKDLPIACFERHMEIIDNQPQTQFIRAAHRVETGEAERIAVDHVSKPSSSGRGGGDSTAVSNMVTQRNAIRMLHERVVLISRYLDAVATGAIARDDVLLRQISALVKSVPASDPHELGAEYHVESNNVALTNLLAKMTEGLQTTNQYIDRFSLTRTQANGQTGSGRDAGTRQRRGRG